MYYRRLEFCIIYLALNRGCFEAVLMKNTPRTLGVKMNFLSSDIHGQTGLKNGKLDWV
jgi:hypothetical protein